MNFESLFDQKGIVGKGFNFYEKCIRFAHVKQEGELFHVLDLQELPLANPDKVFMQMTLKKLGIDQKDLLATSLDDKNLIMRKLFSPPIAKNELLESLRFQFLEETQNNQQNVEIRYDKLLEENEDGLQAFMVYGLGHEQVENLRDFYAGLGLRVVAAEPLASSLASMLELINPAPEKTRGMFYKEGGRILFAGIRGDQMLACKSFGGVHSDGEEVRGDWMIEFQQAIDEFLVQEKLSMLDEAVLVGHWGDEDKQKILMTLGISCKQLNEVEIPQFVFAIPELKSKFLEFLPEISLALFPKANI